MCLSLTSGSTITARSYRCTTTSWGTGSNGTENRHKTVRRPKPWAFRCQSRRKSYCKMRMFCDQVLQRRKPAKCWTGAGVAELETFATRAFWLMSMRSLRPCPERGSTTSREPKRKRHQDFELILFAGIGKKPQLQETPPIVRGRMLAGRACRRSERGTLQERNADLHNPVIQAGVRAGSLVGMQPPDRQLHNLLQRLDPLPASGAPRKNRGYAGRGGNQKDRPHRLAAHQSSRAL